MATGASGGRLFREVFQGCILERDPGLGKRPYHRNCRCALHNKRAYCPHASPMPNSILYPLKKSYSKGCLQSMASPHYSPRSNSPRACKSARGLKDFQFGPLRRMNIIDKSVF